MPTRARKSSELSSPDSLISFTDGDIILRSSDGVDFSVDLVILRRTSSFFDDLTQLPQPHNVTNDDNILQMKESGDVLNILLRHLYNLEPAPITTAAQAEGLLHIVDRLDFSIYSLDLALDEYLASMPPLRAWALAVHFQHHAARKSAVMRYLACDDPSSVDDIPELDLVTGRQLAALMKIKAKAVEDARQALKVFPWCCGEHCGSEWHQGQMEKITASPFNSIHTSDAELKQIIMEYGKHCVGCILYFESVWKSERMKARDAVMGVVNTAVEIEDLLHKRSSYSAGDLYEPKK